MPREGAGFKVSAASLATTPSATTPERNSAEGGRAAAKASKAKSTSTMGSDVRLDGATVLEGAGVPPKRLSGSSELSAAGGGVAVENSAKGSAIACCCWWGSDAATPARGVVNDQSKELVSMSGATVGKAGDLQKGCTQDKEFRQNRRAGSAAQGGSYRRVWSLRSGFRYMGNFGSHYILQNIH